MLAHQRAIVEGRDDHAISPEKGRGIRAGAGAENPAVESKVETAEERRLRVDAAIVTVVDEHRDLLLALAKR